MLLNVIAAVYETSNIRRYPSGLNNQRSADSGYKYAWFTRDIHDDIMSSEDNNLQEEQLSPQRLLRTKTLNSIFNRKYQNNDDALSESNEKI